MSGLKFSPEITFPSAPLSTNEQIKQRLHELILQSDLVKLKELVDSLQTSLLRFDQPSLLLLAIEVYLDPACIHNQEYQQEVVLFLYKCGLSLLIPGGNLFLYLAKFCQNKAQVATDQALQEQEFVTKLKSLFDRLFQQNPKSLHRSYHLTRETDPDPEYLHQFRDYLNQHKAAITIQHHWKQCIKRKKLIP